MNPQEHNGNQWQPKPVTLQAQHYAPGPGSNPGWNTEWHPQQGYWVPPQYVSGVVYHNQQQHRPPPPPPPHGAVFHHHQPPRHMQSHVNAHARKFTNYLSSKPPRGTHKRKRKKDIVPPVEKMTEDAVVRMPVDESERLEIEAWKAERRKYWPSADNIRRKESEHACDTRKIRLVDVLGTQKKLGLTRKAGTDDLVKQHLCGTEDAIRPQCTKVDTTAVAKPLHVKKQKKKPTLLERLLEKDIKMYKAKIVQLFHFVHMNEYLREPQKSLLLFPEKTPLSDGSVLKRPKQPLVPYEESSGSEATSSG